MTAIDATGLHAIEDLADTVRATAASSSSPARASSRSR